MRPGGPDGVFSGLDTKERFYDFHTWQYEGLEVQAASGERDREYGEQHGASSGSAEVRQAARGEAHGSGGAAVPAGIPERDETLTHPRCVFQVLKRHFARYTPEVVERACGVPADTFGQVCESLTENSGRDRTSAFVYSVGWTQHTVGVQYIRTASILQALLGNIGRPGGGILALRGHASIQGSHRHPDPVRPAARLHPDAARPLQRGPGLLCRSRADAEGVLGRHARLHGEPAQVLVGRCRAGGQRLLLRLSAQAHR